MGCFSKSPKLSKGVSTAYALLKANNVQQVMPNMNLTNATFAP